MTQTRIIIESIGNQYCPIEKVYIDMFRVVEFDGSPEEGGIFVKDIYESSVDGLCNLFKYSDGKHFFDVRHDSTNFGRAKKFSSKMRKVIEQL